MSNLNAKQIRFSGSWIKIPSFKVSWPYKGALFLYFVSKVQTVIGLILILRSLKNDFVRLYSNRVQFVLLQVLPSSFSSFSKIMLRLKRVSLKNFPSSVQETFFACTFFSQYRSWANTQEVLSFLFFSLKRVHAGIFMLACALFNEQNKGPILLSVITWFVLGKQNVQAKKVYLRE